MVEDEYIYDYPYAIKLVILLGMLFELERVLMMFILCYGQESDCGYTKLL